MGLDTEKGKLILSKELEMDDMALRQNINDIIQCIIKNNPQISLEKAAKLCEAANLEIGIRILNGCLKVRNSPAIEEFLKD